MTDQPKVLISDKLSPRAIDIFERRGIIAHARPGLSKDELLEIIDQYDGLAVRSATKVTEKLLKRASKLRVIGRAGIGVDNIDIAAASQRGIVVMNTPFGNSVTTAEHAIALLLALARRIPDADRSTQAGLWEKSRFIGSEITGKTLGIIGCGNIGSIVADRAHGLKMKVVAFDPFLSSERARELGVEKITLNALWNRADFITLHTPLTDKTRGMINANSIAKMQKGVRVINCARGALIVEADLRAGLESGHIGGAALDVFVQEPAVENSLFGAPHMICTPHLGASTIEAQEKVALQVAEQMSDYLLTGAVINALNMPSITAEEADLIRPYCKLAEQLGLFAGQLTETGLVGIRLEYEGGVADVNTKALTAAALCGVLRPLLQDVNMVSAPILARQRGIRVEEVHRARQGAYETYMRLTVITERQERSVAGTIFADERPRLIQVKGINMEAELGPHMLYITNEDKPGFIGGLGMALGAAGVNIATFHLGRSGPGGEAIALIEIDEEISNQTLATVRGLPHVKQVTPLKF